MNIKKTIKKVSALATGAAMLGATVMGAVAYDLGDYPQPFVKDGVFSGKLVVGTGGTAEGIASDYLGMVDIATSLQAASRKAVSVSNGVVTVEGGKDFDDLYIGVADNYDTSIDSNDLAGFIDTTFDFDDNDYDYSDRISIQPGGIMFVGSQDDEDYGKDIYAEIATADEIQYIVDIDQDFNWSNVAEPDHDENVEFKVLGKLLKISKFTADTMVVEASSEQYLEEGDEVVVDGHTVKLDKVGDNAVRVSVDGQTKSISTAANLPKKETFDLADDFEVQVESTFYIQDAKDNSATLTLGKNVKKTVTSGDSAELFGEPSKEDDADWLWNINMTALGTENHVGLDLNIERAGLTATDPDERNALAVGESIKLPNGYGEIQYAALKVGDSGYNDLTVEIDDNYKVKPDGGTEVTAWGTRYTYDGDKKVFTVGTEKTKEVWVLYSDAETFDIWFKDGDYETKATGVTDFTFELDNEAFTITPSANLTADSSVAITFPTVSPANAEVLSLNTTFGNDFFGALEDDEAEDLVYSGAQAGRLAGNIGQKDLDGGYFMTNYGVYFENPKNQFGNGNSFTMSVPFERQFATVVVKSKATTTSTSDGGSYQIVDIGLGLAVKDSDAEQLLGKENLIVVGGPYVNSIAAELMGNPTDAQIAEMFEPGKAKIKLFAKQNAILVAGYSAQDTVGAARVLADYNNDKYDLSGDEVEVMVPNLSQLTVGTPTLPSMVDEIQTNEEPDMGSEN